MIGRNTVGIEDGVSVSAKLACATNTHPIFVVASQLAQSITADKSAEPPQSVRVPLYAKKRPSTGRFLCLSLPDHRTFIEDYLKILDFIEWLKEYYPEKAAFLINEA